MPELAIMLRSGIVTDNWRQRGSAGAHPVRKTSMTSAPSALESLDIFYLTASLVRRA